MANVSFFFNSCFSKRTVCLINQTERDASFTIESHLNENTDGDSDDESMQSETSETILPLLLS